ncbi:FeoA domain protein [Oxobacter pfennigii]|uniref:FeoA domain protein n=1 Tax=Oxobacter pfennigii TaxID=36849 RepID=A0A0P8WJQ2_9CLOT|nr:FeoA family protein [Oxobacter pfennigii]KPU42394.1 FeoA domain protein [Oxobacter pfennigii]
MNNTVSLTFQNTCEVLQGSLKLSDVPLGKACKVRTINAQGLLRNRMLDIGIIPDTEIKAMRRNRTGDTTAFLIRGALMALRREESSLIDIELIQEN